MATINGDDNDNLLEGTESDDSISGGLGNDTLIGGLGADSLVGGAGNDVLRGGDASELNGEGGGITLTPTAYDYLYVHGNSLVNGLGNPETPIVAGAGFGEYYLGRNDDGYTGLINITSVFGSQGINLFGQSYTGLYVNNNGNITFDSGLYAFTPGPISAGTDPIIAAFWADVDTRGGLVTPTAGGNSQGSNITYYDLDATNGVLTVTWDDAGYFSSHTDKLNAFQMQLINRGGGNFDIIFRYEAVNWTTGDASDGTGGLGGTVARAGYSAGDGDPLHYYELPQSGNQAQILALDETAGNTGRIGVYVFSVRNGELVAVDGSGDTLDGGDGNDTLDGGGGNDTLTGGAGSDTFMLSAGIAAGIDVITDFQAGSGGDLLDLSGVLDALQNYTAGTDPLASGHLRLALSGTDTLLEINRPGIAHGSDWQILAVLQNTVAANLTSANFSGGYAPALLLYSGSGDDVLTGGDGSDTVSYAAAPSGVTVDLSLETAQNTGHGNDTLISIENLIGSGFNDRFTGNGRANLLDGGTGADTMTGGQGADIYYVDDAGDEVIETDNTPSGSEGFQLGADLGSTIDTVVAGIDYALGSFLENLTLSGSGNLAGSGNALANEMNGNAGDNTLAAEAGNDTITGGGGNDSIDGGDGFDMAVFWGNRAGYTVAKTAGGYSVTDLSGAEGIDSLTGIERLQFANFTVNLGVQAAAQSISATDLQRLEELYVGFFNRIPEADGLEYWISQFKGGMGLEQIANAFYDAGVYFGVYDANMTTAEFITRVYANVLGRSGASAPNESEIAYWEAWVAARSKGAMVLQMLNDSHDYFTGDPVVGWVIDLLDNKSEVADLFAVGLGLNCLTPAESITLGMAIAAAITPTDTSAAIALIGVSDAPLG